MRYMVVGLIVGLLVSGCAAPTEEMKTLKVQNAQLQSDLNGANSSIASLEKKNADLTGQVNQLNRISGTLEKEKAVRVEESSMLRQDVRSFVRNQLVVFREFSKDADFLDYRGGEIIDRSDSPGSSMSLIDTQYQMNATGTLYGIRGQFNEPAVMSLAVLRPVKDQWVVVWSTEKLEVEQPGLQQINFSVPVSVQENDLVAYLFPNQVAVSCDRGTGGLVSVDKQLEAGQKLTQTTSGNRQGWACSIGVVGMLGE